MRKMHQAIYLQENKSSRKHSGKVKTLVYSVDEIYKELFGVSAREWFENEFIIQKFNSKIADISKRVIAAKNAVSSSFIKNRKKLQVNLDEASSALKASASARKPYLNKRAEYLGSMRDSAGNIPDAEKPEYIRDALAGKPTKF